MTDRYPQIRLYRIIDGERFLYVRESVSICFYMRHSHRDVVHAAMRALDIYREAVGPEALAWYPDRNGDWQELDAKGWEFNRWTMLDPHGASIRLHTSPSSVAGYEFTYRGFQLDALPWAEDPGAVCSAAFWLSMEFLEAHGPARVRELALELASVLPFNSGHAGLSLHFPEGGLSSDEHRQGRDFSFRYPGLDIPALRELDMNLGTRIKGAYWLTFLGQPVLGELGGVAGVRARLSCPGTTVQAVGPERAVVTLGEWPEAGDLEKGHPLPAYGELARVLEPWLYKAKSPFWYGATHEEQRRWERRFLDSV
jgi:hypothetical protein